MPHTDKFYIDGQWVDPIGPDQFDVINPATEATLTALSMGNAADVDVAVAAARRAFTEFSQSPVEQRVELLENLLKMYKQRYAEMAELITLELGAPKDYSYAVQTESGQGHIEEIINVLREFQFKQKMSDGGEVWHEAVGVCGLITPWNWPINQVVIKVAPALAAGCTMVLKPSELSPLSALLFAEMVDEAGIPAGVFNLVNGDGETVGARLSAHPDVDYISFTGSTRAGVAIAQAAAPSVKRVSQELGGKSPNIILPDADLETAIRRGVSDCFGNSGQSCDAPSRMLVHKSVYAQATKMAETAANETTLGDPQKSGAHLGPVISQRQFNQIQSLIQAGIDEGAHLLTGGPDRPGDFSKGYYVKPTIFSDVTNSMQIAREEVFGPVLTMIEYQDIDEAIAIANDTPYGLAGCIWGQDVQALNYVLRRMRTGNVYVNGAEPGYASPFGGYKQSGNGREGGIFGLEDFLELKTVVWPEPD